jgi:tetratricopeptide (TPR) repeat protein
LLTLPPHPLKPRRGDYYKAREVIERGLRARPYDGELWLNGGQYIAYLGPQFLSPEEKKEWRQAGARILARSCELIGDKEHAAQHCVTAAGILNREGNREAVVRFLRRVIAIADEDIRDFALRYLERIDDERRREELERRVERLNEAKRQDLPFVPKDLFLVLAPPFDPVACAGSERAEAPGCATSWREWFTD